MNIRGRVQNGVVVLEAAQAPPDGTEVTVSFRSPPLIRVAEHQKRVEFPLVPSDTPGSVQLTNEMIADLLDREDVSS